MQQLWTGIVKLLFCVKTLTVNRDQQKSSWKHLIRFVCVLYFIVSQDYSFKVNMWLNWWRNKVRQRRARTCYYQVKQLIRQNIQFTIFLFFFESFLKKAKGEKMAPVWNYLKIVFKRAFCSNLKLFFPKLLLAMYRFKRKRENETASAVFNKRQNI